LIPGNLCLSALAVKRFYIFSFLGAAEIIRLPIYMIQPKEITSKKNLLSKNPFALKKVALKIRYI
jgi:hypothetical protein